MKSVPYGIIVQGPLYDSTISIVNRYTENCKNAKVILSTWSEPFIEVKLAKLHRDASVVVSEAPKVAGIGNRNRQRISTWNGLSRASLYDCEYILKTRTDHCFTDINEPYLEGMESILKSYVGNRIMIGDIGSTQSEAQGAMHLSDWWNFGQFKDILALWSIHNPFFKAGETRSLNTAQSVEAEVYQLWMLENGIKADSALDLAAKRCVVMNNSDMGYTIYKDSIQTIDWNARRDPLAITHEIWKEAYEKLKDKV